MVTGTEGARNQERLDLRRSAAIYWTELDWKVGDYSFQNFFYISKFANAKLLRSIKLKLHGVSKLTDSNRARQAGGNVKRSSRRREKYSVLEGL
jgi:hypothetical protein